MRVVLQRVESASVHTVEDQKLGSIELGYLLYIGFTHSDTEETVKTMSSKIAKVQLMEDNRGRLGNNIIDANGKILAIPNFTLYAKTKKPSVGFLESAKPEQASNLFTTFIDSMITLGLNVESGKFGAHMIVKSQNDGPVNVIFDSVDW